MFCTKPYGFYCRARDYENSDLQRQPTFSYVLLPPNYPSRPRLTGFLATKLALMRMGIVHLYPCLMQFTHPPTGLSNLVPQLNNLQ